MAKVGLQREEQADNSRQNKGIHPPRRATHLKARSHHPSGDNDKTGLQKLGRLERGKPKRIPANRTLAKIGAKKRQAHQGNKRDKKSKNRHTAYHLRRHHRDAKHHDHRDTAKKGLTRHIVEWLKAVFARKWWRRGQAKQQSNPEKDQNARHRPLINRPPPPWKNRFASVNWDRAIDHFRHGYTANTASNRPIFRV